MKDNTLLFEVKGQYIVRLDSIEPVAKCRNLYKAQFQFKTDEWTETKTALFVQGEYSKSVILDENGTCEIPWEFFDSDNTTFGYVSVYCGDLVTANRVVVDIVKSGYQESDASVPPSPDVYQQLVKLAEDTKEIAQSVRDDADNCVFDGEEGYSPKVSLTEELDGVTVTVQNKDGQQSAKVKNGKDGKDYEHSEEFTKLAEQVRQDKSSVEQTVQGFGNTAQQAIQSVQSAGTQAVGEVNATKTDAVEAVQTEGEEQAQAVEAKGQEVINSIPSDYTTQMATKLDKQQGTENAGKLLGVGTDGNVALMGGASVGEVLLADYTHRGNPEFHFSDFDFATGIGTTTEPHGLTTATSVLICPNDFKVTNFAKDIVTIPIEWTMENGQLQLLPVDDTHLKLIIKHTQKTIPANLEDISNKNVDITKFHFEKPISYVIKNIDSKIKTKYIKVCQIGYINYVGLYRYRRIVTIKKDGSAYVPNYINSLGLSFGGNSPAKNGVLQFSTLYADVRMDLVHYKEDIVVGARRRGQQNFVFDKVRLHNNYEEYMSTGVNGIDRIKHYEAYSDDYANASNGTRIQIYALEGEYKNES